MDSPLIGQSSTKLGRPPTARKPAGTAPNSTTRNGRRRKEVADFGGGPWGAFDGRRNVTVSPLAAADPFRGRFTIPAEVDRREAARVASRWTTCPTTPQPSPSTAVFAGGVIGKPSRLDITAHVKSGENTIVIEPLAPKAVRVVIYP